MSGGGSFTLNGGGGTITLNSSVTNVSQLNNDNNYYSPDGSGNITFNSGYGSNAVAYGVRAFGRFNAYNNNISTIHVKGFTYAVYFSIGKYAITFSSAMPDTNYAITGVCQGTVSGLHPTMGLSFDDQTARSTSVLYVRTGPTGGANSQGFASNTPFDLAVVR